MIHLDLLNREEDPICFQSSKRDFHRCIVICSGYFRFRFFTWVLVRALMQPFSQTKNTQIAFTKLKDFRITIISWIIFLLKLRRIVSVDWFVFFCFINIQHVIQSQKIFQHVKRFCGEGNDLLINVLLINPQLRVKRWNHSFPKSIGAQVNITIPTGIGTR